MFKHNAIIAALACAIAMNAHAVLISADPLPADVYIQKGDLYWAWASPVNQKDWYGMNELMAPEFHAGWRFATNEEMASRPTLADFTRPDGSYIHAVEYWNTSFTHVDATNLQYGEVASAWGNSYYETLYVRAVPEPETYALMAAGLVGVVAARRRKSAA